MSSVQEVVTPIGAWLKEIPYFFLQPVRLFRNYNPAFFRADLMAGITVAVVLLPQAIAYAAVAELPPQVGLYAACVTAIFAALWGSSNHLATGPTNPSSILVFGTLLSVGIASDTQEYLMIAGVMAIVTGLIRLMVGLLRLGFLLNFVSDSVVIGFTTGAGVLIGVSQVRTLLKLQFDSTPFFPQMVGRIFTSMPTLHVPSALLGIYTIVIIMLVKRYRPNWPSALIGMVSAAVITGVAGLDQQGVLILGQLPPGVPTPRWLPGLVDRELLEKMWSGALAAALIGLVDVVSIARSIAAQSGQRLDINQEFVGQGLSNIVAGFFGGYHGSGSFTRSVINYEAGAKSQISSLVCGIVMLGMIVLLGPLIGFLPRPALAGAIIVTAYGMIDSDEIKRTIQGFGGDTAIMIATCAAALLWSLESAVMVGMFTSFVRYVSQTSTPEVSPVLPDDDFVHFTHRPDRPECPQLGVITIQGGLYFGAVRHVEDTIRTHFDFHPEQTFLLLRMHRVNHVDMTGIHMLESIVRLYRQRGGDVFLMRVHTPVMERMQQTGFDELLGADNFLPAEAAIAYLFHRVLDPARCIYACPHRVWQECQSLPKSPLPNFVPAYELVAPEVEVPNVTPATLYTVLRELDSVLLIDIRELHEWHTDGYILNSQLMPLPKFFGRSLNLPADRDIVFVSRTGRRSRHLVSYLREQGWDRVYNLRDGVLGWRGTGLPYEQMAEPPPSTQP